MVLVFVMVDIVCEKYDTPLKYLKDMVEVMNVKTVRIITNNLRNGKLLVIGSDKFGETKIFETFHKSSLTLDQIRKLKDYADSVDYGLEA